ncbi:MAG: hypothetical protein F4077_09810 [Gammaproteobacteria bacterium]|nr:hypothetical protein [Gammaproteobacteria bacterium]MYI78031.1 hypothetical protein [Gammaproteobacteria bacterium]
MLNRRTLWTLAVAEMRSCRRLVRTWVFIVVALLFCVGWYIEALEFQWPSPPGNFYSDSGVSARYTISTLMNGFVAIFSIGIIFLAFDIRARDVQNRISDVIDTQPMSNIEIVIGRLAGIYVLLFIPCLVFLALLTGYESISGLFESRFRLGLQPLSVLSLVAWNLIPNVLFYGALVVCLSVLVRFRLLAAILAIGVLIGFFWINNYIPVRFQESFAQFLGSTIVSSDLAPTFVSPAILVNRCGLLFVSIALILFTASMVQRTEPRRILNSTLSVAAVSIATIVYFSLFAAIMNIESRKDEWVKTHQQQSPGSFPDVHHLEGTVELRPGNNISLDVTLEITKPTANRTDSIIFSLNLGYTLQKLFINGEETTNYNFENGLLKLPSDLLSDGSSKMQLQAKGKPDDSFAYLDQARDFLKLPHKSVRQLGLKNSIFSRDYVALMPGIFWYPISGSAMGRDQFETRPIDVFTTDLTVIVPQRWQVATVGERIEVENQKRTTVQFKSETPVPELALIASDFDKRESTIEGVGFEVLFNKKHLHNLDTLTLVYDQIQEWIAERIKNARAVSLDYPYKVLYVVEVPSNLRVFGGGWRMDTVLQPPGMMLIRESSFPTEEFKNVIVQARKFNRMPEEDQNTYVFDVLLRYFSSDLQGGSPFAGIARNFVSHQLSAAERGGTVLQYLLDQLSNQLITQTESSSLIPITEYATWIPYLGIHRTGDYRTTTRATEIRERVASLPSTWELMDRVALVDLDFNTDPKSSYRVLLTKGYVLAESMIAHFGAERLGALLKQLLTNFRGQSVTMADFFQVSTELGLDFDEWVLPWLEATILPGYKVNPASVSKIESTEFRDTEYQTTFILHNAEPIPGFVRVRWSAKEERFDHWGYEQTTNSDPIFVPANDTKRISIRSGKPVTWIWIDPYLAHNRAQFEVLVPEFDEDTIPDSTAFPFVSEVDWQPIHTGTIIVDDLDPNFSIITQDGDLVDYSITNTDSSGSFLDEYDQGLRVKTYPQIGEWTRLYDSSSYGRYRRTFARAARGDQTSAARFAARLPHNGLWKLEFYVPKPVFREENYGHYTDFFGARLDDQIKHRRADPNSPDEHYTMHIRNGDSDWTEKFDIGNAKIGWNEVGQFEIGSTEVEVLLSDWAGHQEIMVFADAIRWTPDSNTEDNGESSP